MWMKTVYCLRRHEKKVLVKDDRGDILAILYYNGESYQIIREPSCSLGTFFYILSYLRDQDLDVI